MVSQDEITHSERSTRSAIALLTDPRVLPSATTLRFAVLALMLLGTTGTMYAAIGLQLDTAMRIGVDRCTVGASTSVSVARLEGVASNAVAAVGCQMPYFGQIAGWSLAGIAAVVVVTLLAYAIGPWWLIYLTRPWIPVRRWRLCRPWWLPKRTSRQRLRTLGAQNESESAMLSRIEELARAAGLSAAPICLLHEYRLGTGARALTYRRNGYVICNLGLLTLRRTDPLAFDGIMLHELAHLSNRDSRPTYLTYAAGRAFVLVALLPYLAALALPNAITDPLSPHAWSVHNPPLNPHLLVSIGVLAVLTLFARNSVLRAREFHADARAWLTADEAIRGAIGKRLSVPPRRRERLPEALRGHPTPERRRAALGESSVLGRTDVPAMFGAGLAVSLFATNIQWVAWFAISRSSGRGGYYADLFHSILRGDLVAVLVLQLQLGGPPLLVALPLLVGFSILVAWRAELGAGARTHRTWIIPGAIALGLGYVVGEPLSAIEAISGFWGVVDQGFWVAIDVAVSALILILLSGLLLHWAADNAPRGIPPGGSLRRRWALATVIGGLGAAPVFFMWLNYHFSGEISSSVSITAAATVRDWPLSSLLLKTYVPVGYLIALPAAVVLIALPGLATVLGKRATRTRPHVRPGTVLKAGALAAALVVVLDLLFVVALDAAFGSSAIRSSIGHNAGDQYLYNAAAWISAIVAAIAAVAIGRRFRDTSVSTAVVTVLLSTSLAAPLLMVTTVGTLCGDAVGPCLSAHPAMAQILYGRIGVGSAVDGSAVLVIAYAIAATFAFAAARVSWLRRWARRRPEHEYVPDSGQAVAAGELRAALAVSGTVIVLLSVATFCCTRYILVR